MHGLSLYSNIIYCSANRYLNVAASSITPAITSVLDQMKDMKSQRLQMQQTQNFLLKEKLIEVISEARL